jgi:hypothetical protein
VRKRADLLVATGKKLLKKCTAKSQKMASNRPLADVILLCNKTSLNRQDAKTAKERQVLPSNTKRDPAS